MLNQTNQKKSSVIAAAEISIFLTNVKTLRCFLQNILDLLDITETPTPFRLSFRQRLKRRVLTILDSFNFCHLKNFTNL
jgi:hypothetical protein